MTAKGFFEMYRDGFRQMTIGRTLWLLVILKLIVLFFVVKLFFFPDILERDYSSDTERAAAVRHNLSRPVSERNISDIPQINITFLWIIS